ncbi:hypothetical protein M8037_10975 [Sinorhizobium meliloti]|uniref:plasmid partitioning protein RepB C-terminal domain-containing protein n=1 Tax=Rhizobium meliloti TaxID=382 RepID=UPI00207417E4|nr:plasmid partitioning protein RepB C-terminal domain-containing protein [Sinorhizobium meliloti]MCM5689318.1 hypothetical protein [Sinorhizobium meliloti]
MVFADTRSAGTWYLLDGHLRLEALKELGFAKVECLVATDDDTYTYNKRVNRLAPIEEHRMIARAIERGVSSADIADALGLQVESVIRRFRLLEGISPEVAEMLKNTPCSMKVFDVLRQMNAVRQIEAADLMGTVRNSVRWAMMMKRRESSHGYRERTSGPAPGWT